MIENTARVVPKGLTPWKPGCPSPNPGGRPKGLAQYVRDQTLDGRELVDFLLEVMRTGGRFTKMSDRLKACEMLLDRGLGKVPNVPEGDAKLKPIIDLDKLTDAEHQFLENVRLGLAAIRERVAGGETQEKPQ